MATKLEKYIKKIHELNEAEIDPATTGSRFQLDIDDDDEDMSEKKKQIVIKVNRILRNRQSSVQNIIAEFLDCMDTPSIMDAFERVEELETAEHGVADDEDSYPDGEDDLDDSDFVEKDYDDVEPDEDDLSDDDDEIAYSTKLS